MARKKNKNSSEEQSPNGDSYYYLQGQRVNISKRGDLVAVCFHSRTPAEAIEAFGATRSADFAQSEEFKEMQQGNVRLYTISTRGGDQMRTLADDIRVQPNVEQVGEVYTNEYGQPLVLTDEIVCKFKPELTSDQIEAINNSYNLEISETLGFSENTFILKLKPEMEGNAMEIANQLVEQGHAVYANPSWIEHIPHRMLAEVPVRHEVRHAVNDPLFADQWHLENTGQGGGTVDADVDAHGAWHITRGDTNVRVAIVDSGIDINHEDLNTPGKIIAPLDLNVTPPDNNPAGGAHGTSCAGVAVAAQNNNRGVSGIAPGCRLIPIRASSDQTTTQVRLAQAFQYAADRQADVISCSLGPDGVPWILNDVLRDAIDYATTYGRNGRGCVIFWAGGNGNESISTDQIVSYEKTIAVGASNNLDQRSAYSDFGPELDVVAPSSDSPPPGGTGTLRITTTTNTGAGSPAVDPSRNYTNNFGGTSSASPLAAGTGALVLSVNRNLSWEEVRQVLLDSADKIDAVANPYAPAPANRPPGTRNDRYGYGRVNARRAVQLARVGSRRDLYIRDSVSDTGTVPQPNWGFWNSPDIWVRNRDDGGLSHQNTRRGQDNFVYCRVRNRGSVASLPCWVRFYITTFAGTQFRYPYDYKPDTTSSPAGGTPGNLRPSSQFPTPATYLIGEQRIGSIPAGGNVVTNMRWERTLIPPAANWHPCLLVEISPHDGPAAAGVHVWENNNLGQKNITIVNARRRELLEFPFRFGHIAAIDPFVTLKLRKIKAPRDWQLFVDVKDPNLLASIAHIAGVPLPPEVVAPIEPIPPDSPVSPIVPIAPITPISPILPWRLTFLEDARFAISGGDAHPSESSLIFTFPQGSSIEVGQARLDDLKEQESQEAMEFFDETKGTDGNGHTLPIVQPPFGIWPPPRPAFNITALEGEHVLALNPALKLAPIKIPLEQGLQKETSLKIRVPDNAVIGETYIFDLAEQNATGQLVGGVRLQVNVVD